jgi:putative ABC transport system permease protein
MVGVTMFAFASIFAASARSTIRNAVEEGSKAEMILQNTDGFSAIAPKAADAVATLPGVERVTRVRFTHARAAGESRSVVGIDPATFGELYDAGDGQEALAELGPGETVISKKLAEDSQLQVGDRIDIRTPRNGAVPLRIVGIVDDKGHVTGQLTVTLDELKTDLGVDKDGVVFVGVEPARDPKAVQRDVEALLKRDFPQVKALSNEEFIDAQAKQIDQLLYLIYALLALTVIVALFGIVNTLVLSITERTRELGMLRAIGTSRRQIRGMIRMESVIMGTIGGILGLVLGTGLAVLVSRVVDDFRLSIPVGTMAALLVLAALAGVLASVIPARRAARLDVLRALAYE